MRLFSDTIYRIIVLFILSFSLTSAAFGQSWIQESSSTIRNLNDVWVAASVTQTPPPAVSLRIFCVGDNGTIVTSSNGTNRTTQDSGTNLNLNAVWGGAINNVFSVGDTNKVSHYDGQDWLPVNVGGAVARDLQDVWGHVSGSTTRVYAVGTLGRILSFNGTDWISRDEGNQNLRGVWGASPNDIFVVGDQGTILHFDGQSWKPQASGMQSNLNSVWGTSPRSVFAVGDEGVILWYNGETWLRMQSNAPLTATFTAVWGTSHCSMYAVGESLGQGIIFFFDGTSWSSQSDLIAMTLPGAPVPPLRGIYGGSIRNIFVVGDATAGSGFIMSYDPEGPGRPLICAKQPAGGEEEVLIDTEVAADFNAVMDASTITNSTFVLSSGSGQVTGTVTYSNNTATFTPSNGLARSTAYTATLSKDIKDTLGVSLGTEDFTWSFTTGSESSGGSSGGGCFISTAKKASVGRDRFRAIRNIFGRKYRQR